MLLLDALFGGLAAGGLRNPWAWSVAAVVLWGAACVRPPDLRRIPGAAYWAAWLAWAAASALFSKEPFRGLSAWTYGATAVLFFALACGRWTRETKRIWFGFLLGAGYLLGIAAIVNKEKFGVMIGLLQPYYNYTAALEAAVFSAAFAALAAAYGRHRTREAWLPLVWGVAAFSGSILVASRSRGAVAAASAAAVYVLWREGYRRTLAGLAVAALVAFAAAPKDMLHARLKLDNPGANLRPALWNAALRIAGDHPFFGEGPGQFDRGFLRHAFPSPPGYLPTRYGRRSAHAHSEALQMAAETGWPGLALFLLALGAALRRHEPDGAARGCPRSAARAVVVSLLVSSLLDNIFALPALHWLFFSALAVQASGADVERTAPRPSLRPLYVLGLALAVFATAPAWLVNSHRARSHRLAPREGIAQVRRAMRWAGEDPELWADLARAYLREGRLREALLPLAQAQVRDPTNAVYPLVLAEIGRVRKDWRHVVIFARRALELEPQCSQGRLFLAEALYHLGEREAAAAELERSVRDRYGSPRSWGEYVRMVRDFDLSRYEELKKLITPGATEGKPEEVPPPDVVGRRPREGR